MSDFLETKYNRTCGDQPINLLKDATMSPYISTEKTVDWRNLSSADDRARDFWERCVLACLAGMARSGQPQIACEVAETALAEWRKRFDPREKA